MSFSKLFKIIFYTISKLCNSTLCTVGLDKEAIQRHEALTRDFQKLKDELVAEGMFEPSIPHVIYRISELIGFLVLGMYLLMTSQSWPVWTFGLLCFAMYQGRSGWLMHEGGHHSLTGVPNVDRFLQAVIYGIKYNYFIEFAN